MHEEQPGGTTGRGCAIDGGSLIGAPVLVFVLTLFLTVPTPFGIAPPRAHAQTPAAPELVSIQSIRDQRSEVVSAGRVVQVEGVVTHLETYFGDIFIQDESAGIYLTGSEFAARVRRGNRVRVVGTVDRGSFSPCLLPEHVEVIGQSELPAPELHLLGEVDSRWLDARRVQVRAIVRGITANASHVMLELVTRYGTGKARIPCEVLSPERAARYLDCAVRITGVCGSPEHDTETRRAIGDDRILVHSLEDIEVLGEPTTFAPVPIGQWQRGYLPGPVDIAGAVVLEGVVTFTRRPEEGLEIFVQDDRFSVSAHLKPGVVFQVGDRVSVSGFPKEETGRVLVLEQAHATRVAEGVALPAPVTLSASDLMRGEHWGERVSVQGRIESRPPPGERGYLHCTDGPVTFSVCVWKLPPDAVPASWVPGRLIRVEGVAEPLSVNRREPNGFQILTAQVGDVELLSRPTRMTPAALRNALFATLGSLLLVGMWVYSLRRQVRRQTRQIRKQFKRASDMELSLHEHRRLQAIGRLVSGIAHDFNNLLAVISNGRELTAAELPSDHAAREYIDLIGQAAERGTELTRQLLTFAREEPIHRTTIDLVRTVKESEKLVRRTIGDAIHVKGHYPDEPLPIVASEGAISQLLLNLAANARDAMPDGGTLEITLERVGSESPAARLSICDTGTGMDDDTKARIFDPFFTTKEIGRGTGLGLATAYGTVLELGGTIEVETELGRGTRFTIEIPLSDGSPDSSQESAHASPQRTDATGRVLLVEDNDHVRLVTSASLERLGFEVESFADPLAALDQFEHDPSLYDVLVTDALMPGLVGPELAFRIRRIRPDFPVVVMSGHPREELPHHELLCDDDPYLRKPFPSVHLAGVIHSTLAGQPAENAGSSDERDPTPTI